MRILRGIGKWFWRFMIIFSFIVNLVLIIILLLAGLFIFQIKAQIADPLIGGLHSTAVGLDEATIDWVIPVRDTIPVKLDIPLQTNTTVVLTDPVPLTVSALIDLPGLNASNVPATVQLTLPEGLALPVALDLVVPVDEPLDIALDVRAVIPLRRTQLHDPFEQLALLFEPLSIGLHNLPNNFNEAGDFVGQVWNGAPLDGLLLATDGSGFNPDPYDAWTGFSMTAGYNYPLFTEQYPPQTAPLPTNIVVPGGIPALDASLERRSGLYENGSTPQEHNEQAITVIQTDPNINPATWNGDMYIYYGTVQNDIQNQQAGGD